ncbi:MAG: hypothetical protein P1V97_29365, partial [Planctomycetota bacterium]|nr:hypothetical protein [Planctomycetota bacterium]
HCLVFCALISALTACTAPPPPLKEREIGRPVRDSRTLDALVVDSEGNATWLVDLLIRGSAPISEPDDWDFFEIEVENKEDPVVWRFRDLRRVYVGAINGTRLSVTLVPREGTKVTGTVPRRSYLEGLTEFGPMSIKLREVRQISFGGDRKKTDIEKEARKNDGFPE